jgi:CRISPR-associated protein Csb1
MEIDREAVRALFATSLEVARKAGFNFLTAPIRLTPQDKLIEIVRRSQTFALEGEGGEAVEGDQ